MSAATSSDTPTESHVLLDVPPDVGEQLHAWLANSAAADVSVEIAEDRNAATLTVNGTRLPGALTTVFARFGVPDSGYAATHDAKTGKLYAPSAATRKRAALPEELWAWAAGLLEPRYAALRGRR